MLCLIAENNSQVNRILSDSDVFEFYMHILSGKEPEKLQDSAEKRVLVMLYNFSKKQPKNEDLDFTVSDMSDDYFDF